MTAYYYDWFFDHYIVFLNRSVEDAKALRKLVFIFAPVGHSAGMHDFESVMAEPNF